MNYLIISTSLNPDSNGRILAGEMKQRLTNQGNSIDFVDLQDYELPLCGSPSCYSHPHVQEILKKLEAAQGILLAVPIYNYNVAATAKNLLELTGDAWAHKVIGLMCAAGGDLSYMSVLPFINGLMLDYRCIIAPRYVYASKPSFSDDHTKITDKKIHERLDGLAKEFTILTNALHGKLS